MSERKPWTPADVVDVAGPPALLRNYLEQRDVRSYLHKAAAHTPIQRAYDIGSGFGRLTPVLCEAAAEVVGFEREASLVATAKYLLPDLRFELVPTLERLPAAASSAEFVLTFTVLQHMPDSAARAVIGEILRVLAPAGHLLIVEETDVALEAGDAGRADLGYTRGRSVEWYVEALKPLQLLTTSPRRIEPGYPRQDVGTYMFFRRP
jgi:SAM-dependent methyltransferase